MFLLFQKVLLKGHFNIPLIVYRPKGCAYLNLNCKFHSWNRNFVLIFHHSQRFFELPRVLFKPFQIITMSANEIEMVDEGKNSEILKIDMPNSEVKIEVEKTVNNELKDEVLPAVKKKQKRIRDIFECTLVENNLRCVSVQCFASKEDSMFVLKSTFSDGEGSFSESDGETSESKVRNNNLSVFNYLSIKVSDLLTCSCVVGCSSCKTKSFFKILLKFWFEFLLHNNNLAYLTTD